MSDGMDSLGRVRAQALIFLVVTFAAGVLCGMAVHSLIDAHGRGHAGPPPIERGPHPLPPFLARLDLTDQQREAIHGILQRGRPRAEAVLRETMPRLRAVTDSVRAEIRATLTDAQRVRFDSLVPRDMPLGPGPFGRRPPPGMAPPPWEDGPPPGGPR